MAEKRRLQGEIDRTLKKVHEGRMSFKDTLDKFESSTNQAQKEKHEADLKKEIKKLQRFRDNIKTWLASPDVKDKTQLTEMRKLIESDMERFKVIEKETKTKAYSKEGLYIETKKDPVQKEKEDHIEWLKSQISKLSKNIEMSDFEIIKLNTIKKKRNLEKDRLSDLNQKVGMFKNHLSKQETLMRLLDNDKIELDKVRDFRDSFEDFINNIDNDAYKCDQGLFIYDELNLEELSADISMAAELDTSGKVDTPSSDSLAFANLSYFVEKKESVVEKVDLVTETNSVDELNSDKTIQQKPIDKSKEKSQPKLIKPKYSLDISINDNGKLPKNQSINITSTPIKTSSVPLDSSDFLSIHNISDSSIREPQIEVPVSNLVSCQQINIANTPILETVSNIDTPVLKESYATDVIKSTVVTVPESFSIAATSSNYITTFSANHEPVLKSATMVKPKIEPSPHLLDIPSCQSFYELPNNFQQVLMSQNEVSLNHQFGHRPSLPSMLEHPGITPLLSSGTGSGPSNPHSIGKDNTIDMILEPGDAMSPFRNHGFQNNDYYNNQVAAMDHGRLKQPLTSDSEKARLIIHRNEIPVPDYFPRDPLPGSDTEDYYMRLDSDTLFFIFYYFEGTKAQYLAAKALKRMSWRFHTGHMCWFQRHEEPKQITDNSESGTYIFYDFESMSRQKKENFTFSYNYLEDKDF